METIRTDLNKAGLLYRHPDIKQGFPECWISHCPLMYGTLGASLNLIDNGEDEDYSDEELVSMNYEPALALVSDNIYHLEVHPGDADNEGIWLLFTENYFIGYCSRYHRDVMYFYLVNSSLWEKIAHNSGFKHVVASKINGVVAPYDPKIYITKEQHVWAVSQPDIYDPYA